MARHLQAIRAGSLGSRLLSELCRPPNGNPPLPWLNITRTLRSLTPRWQEYQAQTHRAKVPTPACIPSGVQDATAAALDERWANHWKAKTARAAEPAPVSAAALVATLNGGIWPFASSAPPPVAPFALVAPFAPATPATPTAPAAPAAPTAPAALVTPTEPVATAETNSACSIDEMWREVLDAMTEEESFEAISKTEVGSFEELLGAALVPLSTSAFAR